MTEKDVRNPLPSILDELQKCAKCGSCRSVCPIFNELGREKFVARGKVALCQAVAAGTLPLTGDLEEIVGQCLLCLTCVDNCSRDVNTDRIISALRAEYHRLKSAPAIPDGIKPHLDSDATARRFPHEKLNFRQSTGPSLRDRLPDRRAVEQPVDEVSFFFGCATDHLFPQIGTATVDVLNRLDVSVLLPKDQVCCGAPYYACGDFETAQRLAQENIERLSPTDHGNIVTVCATGGHMLKKIYPGLFDSENEWFTRAEKLAERTFDISEYLVDHIGIETISSHIKTRMPHTVTYHDPCHLSHGQGIRTAPRELLKLACGDNFKKTDLSSECCGAGIIFGKQNPELSHRIRSRRVDTIQSLGAAETATGCPACILQLGGDKEKDDIHVSHTIEILAHSMGLGQSKNDR